MTSRAIALVILMAAMGGTARADDYVLVGNAANPTADLSVKDVKDVYSGKTKQWSNGVSVQLVLTGEDSPELAWVATSFFGVNARALMSKIRQEVFKGDMSKPISAVNETATIEKLSATKGGIGVVSVTATKSLPSSVSVIQIRR